MDKNELKNINWRNSEQREIVLSDLITGIIPVEENLLSAEDAWDLCYGNMVEFNKVPFKQFKARLKDHRKQVRMGLDRSKREEEALVHDRLIHPRRLKNSRGELVFDLHPAKELLRDDIKEGKHLIMKPGRLQKTQTEYKQFNSTKFKEGIYQEVCRKKFIHYLNKKRIKEGIKLN